MGTTRKGRAQKAAKLMPPELWESIDQAKALARSIGAKEPYLSLLEEYLRVFALAERLGVTSVPELSQHVASELFHRMGTPIASVGGEEDLDGYRQAYKELLARIDDNTLRFAPGSTVVFLLDLYALKYDCAVEELYKNLTFEEGLLATSVGETKLPLRTVDRLYMMVYVDFVTVKSGSLVFELRCGLLDYRAAGMVVDGVVGKKRFAGRRIKRPDMPRNTLFPEYDTNLAGYVVEVPWNGRDSLRLSFAARFGQSSYPLGICFGKFAPLDKKVAQSYWDVNGALMRYVEDEDGAALSLVRSTRARRIAAERSLQREMLATRGEEALELCGWRRLGFLAREERYQSPRQVWLISDRPVKAGDNGEALFTYLCEHPIKDVEPIFALTRDSEDFERLAKIGRVVPFGSRSYKQLFLRADVVISSAGDEWVINAFGDARASLMDLYGFDYVFLQHGVTQGCLFSWLRRYNKNIKLLVSSAQRERESLLDERYGYDEQVVRLTGFPRHDSLVREAQEQGPQKIVYLMPTWRKSLTRGAYDVARGRYPRNPDFENSDFYRFYQGLLEDERLMAALRSHGYRLRFTLHPSLWQETPSFRGNDVVEILERCSYREAFVDGALLITDYSSVAFDFALLRKPLVYAQFDLDVFYSGHIYNTGYFNYVEDGFGPVCHTLEETVDAIVALLENDCVMPEEYKTRVDTFFGEQPTSRCKAVVDAILDLGK